MIIRNKLKFYKPNEIKNILEELYGLNYSESHIYKVVTALGATIKIGRVNHVLEEFIKYLFVEKLNDSIIQTEIKIKITERKRTILEDIRVEQLRFKQLRIKKKNKLLDKKEKKKIQEESKKEIVRKINKNICIIY
ncbi:MULTISPECIES: hypothetical protein [unclassified Borrelia]|uniref:hypothetical protein n=1 Tax=unclassified Borrelia TaxID=2649934 RepID=UPI001E2F7A49|nr:MULTISPECIES: hypothetical protein [unclassified Borrelia]UGQ16579.1 hypothetical protein LSO06_04500 [Borrelia sp. RT5S]UGQ17751.1 hypothetical protein LSO05_04805 [Borrelia sp. RT1S]